MIVSTHFLRISLKALSGLAFSSILICCSSTFASADGYPIIFRQATDEQYTQFSQTCDLDIAKTDTDEFASMRHFDLYRSNQDCLNGVRGQYCATFFWNSERGVCSLVLYTKYNGFTGDLSFGPTRGTPLVVRHGGSDISPVFFEGVGGTIAVSETSVLIEVISVENLE